MGAVFQGSARTSKVYIELVDSRNLDAVKRPPALSRIKSKLMISGRVVADSSPTVRQITSVGQDLSKVRAVTRPKVVTLSASPTSLAA